MCRRHHVYLAMCSGAFCAVAPSFFSFSALGITSLGRSLRPQGVLHLFAAVLQEGRILLHSTKPALLAAVAEGIFALMYPLQWPYAYIPVLPRLGVLRLAVRGGLWGGSAAAREIPLFVLGSEKFIVIATAKYHLPAEKLSR